MWIWTTCKENYLGRSEWKDWMKPLKKLKILKEELLKIESNEQWFEGGYSKIQNFNQIIKILKSGGELKTKCDSLLELTFVIKQPIQNCQTFHCEELSVKDNYLLKLNL